MTLSEKLNSYDNDYWDFSDYREKNPVIQYPAKMVAPMQRQLLSDILEFDTNIHNVLDPFMGSGTVLDIGKELGLGVLGFDINPLAVLITSLRLNGIPTDTINISIDRLFARFNLLLGNVPPYTFPNINKWFRNDVISSLSIIRKAIMEEQDIRTRRFFWCCFAETIKKFSNTRTSTFKLHIKEELKILNMENNCIDEFKNNVSEHYKEYCFSEYENSNLMQGDSVELFSQCENNSIDLICTSPPYGDNHTTVTYGQYSILPLLWIDRNDLELFDGNLLEKFNAIDSKSLGGKIKKDSMDLNDYSTFLSGIEESKKKKVISFWADYEKIFEQMARVLKPEKLLILTLGNRRVSNKELPFDKFNDFLAHKYNLNIETTLTRNIIGKRMPLKVSYISSEQGPVKSMSKEYIKIYRKNR